MLRSRGEPLDSVADVIQLHRQHHAREVLMAACREAIATGSVKSIVNPHSALSTVTVDNFE